MNTSTQLQNVPDAPLEITKMSFDDIAKHAHVIETPELVDKSALVGKEFIVLDACVRTKNAIAPYVSLTCLLRDKSQVVINDGSTGIFKQATGYSPKEYEDLIAEESDDVEDKDRSTVLPLPLYCKKGLRKSDYEGPKGPASTYYLTGGKFAA